MATFIIQITTSLKNNQMVCVFTTIKKLKGTCVHMYVCTKDFMNKDVHPKKK